MHTDAPGSAARSMGASAILALLLTGCGDDDPDASPSSGVPSSTSRFDPTALYAPLLDDVPPQDCSESNCDEWPLRGTEWRLWKQSDASGNEVGIEPGGVYTLLFSEVDDRLVGRFACSELRATFTYDGGSTGEPVGSPASLELDELSIPGAECGLSDTVASQDEALRTFLADDALMVSTGGSILQLENATGGRLLYQARLDALDGVLRPFRVIAGGDRLGEAYDEATAASGFIVYESADDFPQATPNLAAALGDAVSGVDFDRETLVGLFVEPLEYLGPTIRADFVVERETGTEVSTEAGLFWCDDGLGQPRGDNAPYSLIAIESTRRPVTQAGFVSEACP